MRGFLNKKKQNKRRNFSQSKRVKVWEKTFLGEKLCEEKQEIKSGEKVKYSVGKTAALNSLMNER